MNEEQLVVLGWHVNIDEARLKSYLVEFQTGYSKELLDSYVRKGEHSSPVPFGVSTRDGKIYVVTETKPATLSISNNPATFVTETVGTMSTDWLETYVLTCMHTAMQALGYSLPSSVKGLKGKSKREISYRTSPSMNTIVSFAGNNLSISCYRAERFQCVQNGSEVIVFYDPRHEISEDRFGLVSPERVELLVKSEWSSARRNPNSANDRFLRIDHAIAGTIHRFPVQMQRLEECRPQRIRRPFLRFGNGALVDLEGKDTPYSKIVVDNLDYSSGPKSIAFLVDETGGRKSDESILSFADRFQAAVGRETEVIAVTNADSLPQVNAESVVAVLDDSRPGSGYVHDWLKSVLAVPSKMVLWSTILGNDEREKNLQALIWMSLRFRGTQKLHHTFEPAPDLQPLAVNLLPVMNGRYLILAGATIEQGLLRSRIQLLKNDFTGSTPNEDAVCSLIDGLVSDRSVRLLLMFSERVSLPRLLSVIGKERNCVVSQLTVASAVMLAKAKDYLSVPQAGTFRQIVNDRYLMQTDGSPDFIEEGVPKPILVELHNKAGVSPEDIINYISWLTYVHPSSLGKPKLPIPLHMIQSIEAHTVTRLMESWALEGFLQ